MNVLVTGGSGRLGNFVCPYLKENGYNVASFDMVPPNPESENAKAGIPFVMGNLTNLGDCLRAITFAQPDIIVHLGALPNNSDLQAPFSKEYTLGMSKNFNQIRPEWATMEINTMGTFYVLDAARRLGVKKVIFASSYFVLGTGNRISGTPYIPAYLPMDEEHPLLTEDVYSLSKVLGEEICKSFTRAYNMQTVAMRLLGVHYYNSPRIRHKFDVVVPDATEEDKGWLLGATYQYADARDIAIFVKLAMEAENLKPFEAFFVSTDTTYTEPTKDMVARRWPSLAEMAKNIEGTDGIISGKKAEKLLGFKSQYSWRLNK